MNESQEAHLKILQRFHNFWSNVSKLQVASTVPEETQIALIRGSEAAYSQPEVRDDIPRDS